MAVTAARRDRNTVKAVERAARMLLALAQGGEPMTLTHLSRCLDLHPSTTYRLLWTLRNFDFVEQSNETGRYMLGPALATLAEAAGACRRAERGGVGLQAR